MGKTKSITRKAPRARAKVSPSLAYHAEKKVPIHRLPFVGGDSFWNVHATGGYGGGCETGGAMATAYFRHMKENPEFRGGLLQHIVLDMCEAYKRDLSAAEKASLRGQIVGFFSAICATLQNTAPLFLFRLDAAEETQLLEAANAGLAGYTRLGPDPVRNWA